MSANFVDPTRVEEEINHLLLKIADLQNSISEDLNTTESPSVELRELALGVVEDTNYWISQCTCATESPPILLRRMQIQLERLVRIEKLLEEARR